MSTTGSKPRSSRSSLVRSKFLNRWANIFLEKTRKEGVPNAKEWANRTLNKEDVDGVAAIIRAKRGTK